MGGSYEIGFSTTHKWPSRLIRWLTRSQVSHVWISFPAAGTRLVIQADTRGVHVDSWDNWAPQQKIVARFRLLDGSDRWAGWRGGIATRALFGLLHRSYDWRGALGVGWVLLGRCLGARWRNPLASSAYFCSELGAEWLRIAGVMVPLDPETATPEDVMRVCRSVPGLLRFDREGSIG